MTSKLTYDEIQKPILRDVLKSLRAGNKTVLAAAPCSGKTKMSYKIAKKLKKHGAVLVLAHHTTFLKGQYYQSMIDEGEEGIRMMRTKGDLDRFVKDRKNMNPKSKKYPWMLVAIPQNLLRCDKKKLKTFKTVITDEAHHNYFSESYGLALNTIKPKYNLALTGTPAKFIAEGDEYNIISLAAEDLKENNLIDLPRVEIALADTDFTKADYNADDELKGTAEFPEKSTQKDLDNIVKAIIAQLGSKDRVANKLSKKAYKAAFEKVGKTMIVAKTIKQATFLQSYLETKGVDACLSTSEDDVHSDEIRSFVDRKDGVLIVVQRGILGLNDASIMNIVDMACSINPNTIFQLLARLFRKTKKKQTKLFIKLVPKSLQDITTVHTSFTMALMFREVYESFDGRYSTAKVVTTVRDIKEGTGDGDRRDRSEYTKEKKPFLQDYDFFKPLFKKYRKGVATVAMANIREINGIKNRGIWKGTSKKENKKEASKYETRPEYTRGSQASYKWSRSQGWLDEFFPRYIRTSK